RSRLGRKPERPSVAVIVEGLDAHRIPGAEQALAPAVPEREGEISGQAACARTSPMGVGPDQEVRVGVVAGMMQPSLERCPQLDAIVDAAVQDQAQVSRLVAQGLA